MFIEPSERKPLKPGKAYGTKSLYLTMVGWLMLLLLYVTFWHIFRLDVTVAEMHYYSLCFAIVLCLPLVGPVIITGVVYGIWEYQTEGWRYAFTGLILSALYFLLVVSFIVYIMFVENWW